MVSAEVKEEFMTLQGIQTNCSQLTSQNPKTVKSHLSLTLMRVKLVSNVFHIIGFDLLSDDRRTLCNISSALVTQC